MVVVAGFAEDDFPSEDEDDEDDEEVDDDDEDESDDDEPFPLDAAGADDELDPPRLSVR